MNRYINALTWKLRSLLSRKISFSATIMGSEIHSTAAIRNHTRIYDSSIGKYSYISRNSLLQCADVGCFCSISEGCNIGMPSHPIIFLSTSPVFLSGGNYLKKHFATIPYDNCPRTTIGNDVWIGAHTQIKSGIKIGSGSIIAAGAVVTKDVPNFAIVGGVPARVIKYRFDEPTIKKIEEIKWWDLSEPELECYAKDFDKVDLVLSKLSNSRRE